MRYTPFLFLAIIGTTINISAKNPHERNPECITGYSQNTLMRRVLVQTQRDQTDTQSSLRTNASSQSLATEGSSQLNSLTPLDYAASGRVEEFLWQRTYSRFHRPTPTTKTSPPRPSTSAGTGPDHQPPRKRSISFSLQLLHQATTRRN